MVGNGFLFYRTPPTLFDQEGETDRRTTLDVYSLSLDEGKVGEGKREDMLTFV